MISFWAKQLLWSAVCCYVVQCPFLEGINSLCVLHFFLPVFSMIANACPTTTGNYQMVQYIKLLANGNNSRMPTGGTAQRKTTMY